MPIRNLASDKVADLLYTSIEFYDTVLYRVMPFRLNLYVQSCPANGFVLFTSVRIDLMPSYFRFFETVENVKYSGAQLSIKHPCALVERKSFTDNRILFSDINFLLVIQNRSLSDSSLVRASLFHLCKVPASA